MRDVRVHAGLTGKELSQKTSWQPSKVSRLETGRQLPSEADILRWIEICGLDDLHRTELLALREAATTAHRTWKQRMRRGQQPVQADYNQLVESSTRIRHFETAWVPGLLQTPDYARAVFTEMVSLHHVGLMDVDAAVATRMRRQQFLYDMTKRFEFLLAEPVLRWRFCPSPVLRTQLDRLRGVIGLPNVRFGVLPLDTMVATPPQNAFQLYDSTAIVETFAGETTYSPGNSAVYSRVLERLWVDALTGKDALTILERAGVRLDY
jgi:transcriptional regulator with XRE-family HTH domain